MNKVKFNFKTPLFPVAVCLCSCILLLYGCHVNSTYTNREEDKKEAEKITNTFYAILGENNYSETHPLFGRKFFDVTDTGKLNNIYKATFQKLGKIQNVKLESWQTLRVEGTNPKSEYVLIYQVGREKFNSKETISLVKEDNKIKIMGYHVNSDGFLVPQSN